MALDPGQRGSWCNSSMPQIASTRRKDVNRSYGRPVIDSSGKTITVSPQQGGPGADGEPADAEDDPENEPQRVGRFLCGDRDPRCRRPVVAGEAGDPPVAGHGIVTDTSPDPSSRRGDDRPVRPPPRGPSSWAPTVPLTSRRSGRPIRRARTSVTAVTGPPGPGTNPPVRGAVADGTGEVWDGWSRSCERSITGFGPDRRNPRLTGPPGGGNLRGVCRVRGVPDT